MTQLELQRLRDLPIEGVAERLGLKVKHHKALCPFHSDHTPSLSFNLRKNTYRCFVCGASGDGISLVMNHLHKDFLSATKWLADEHNIITTLQPTPPPGEVGRGPHFDASRYERFFLQPYLNEAARHFLFTERKLDPRVIRWCRLTSWKDKQGTNWLQIPYYNQEGSLIGIQNRRLRAPSNSPIRGGLEDTDRAPSNSPIRGGLEDTDRAPSNSPIRGGLVDTDKTVGVFASNVHSTKASPHGGGLEGALPLPRFRFPTGSRCSIYNLPVLNLLKPGEDLFITEGASDCWAMLSSGHKAIAIPSATLLNAQDLTILKDLPLSKGTEGVSFHMYPDRDLPGERLFLQLREHLPNLQHHQLPPTCKDFSDLYLLQNVEILKNCTSPCF